MNLRRRSSLWALALLVLLLPLGGCFGPWRRPTKAPASGAWIGDDRSNLTAATLADLQRARISEYFVDAARLEWSGGEPVLRPGALDALPGRAGATLVVRGSWPAEVTDGKTAGKRLAAEIERLRLDAEGRGLLAVGVHLDVDAGGSLGPYAAALSRIRGDLDRSLFVSASMQRGWLDDRAASDLAQAVDFLVVFVYGQRPGEREDPKAWDFEQVQANLRRADDLGRPYFIGCVTLGSARHLGPRGEPIEASSRVSLKDLVFNPRLRLQGGFTLEGIDRQVYGFQAVAPTTVGDWQIAKDDVVRVVSAGTTNIHDLHQRIASLALRHALGEVFYRLPGPEEGLALTAGNLADAAAPSPPAVDLLLTTQTLSRSADRVLFKVVLENRNDERSDVSTFDNNFVELGAEGGLFGDVEPGGFQRFELLRQGSDRVDMEALRNPQRVRLFLPLVEGKERIESGPIELRVQGRDPRVVFEAHFIMSDGRAVNVQPVTWTPGS